ncbi:MAG: hypothetical protein PVJ02_11470 [Gemmatimonadota bacterium]|jgi:hypothetical protein
MRTLKNLTGGSRFALGAAALAAALLTLAPSTAWARTVPSATAADSAETAKAAKPAVPTLQVENNNWMDVHVYLVQDGEPLSLGMVTGPGTTEFRLPMMATMAGSDVQLLVLPIGGNDDYLSPLLTVNPGDVVDLTVQNSLPLSSVVVSPGS